MKKVNFGGVGGIHNEQKIREGKISIIFKNI